MKVKEDGSDREVEAHIHIDGKIPGLEEYGEYVDPKDNAICCYIPVDEGDVLKISGRFSGTTLVVAYDAIVDGVCRKAGSYAAKHVQAIKKRKFDFDTFLYQVSDGVIDTSIRVAQLGKTVDLHADGSEIVGAIELRLHFTRQFDVEHDLGKIRRYNEAGRSTDEGVKSAGSTKIDPQFIMEFEKNCAPLEKRKVTQEQKKIDAKRPGTMPWVVFRYYYRSKESIVDQKMELTYHPETKAKPVPRLLQMEAVPSLPLGAKPATDEGDNSTRASSPPDVPSTPTRTPVKKLSTPKPETPSSKELSKSTTKMALTDTPNIKRTPANSTKHTPTPGLHKDSMESTQQLQPSDQPPKVHTMIKSSRPRPQSISSSPISIPPVPRVNMYCLGPGTSADISGSINGNNDKVIQFSEGGVPDNKGTEAGRKKPSEQQAIPKPRSSANGFASDASPAHGFTVPGAPTVNFPRLPSTASKKHSDKPTPISTSAESPLKKMAAPSTPTTPTKRAADIATTLTPELKRTKIMSTSASASPQPLSIELQVAEQRKRLEAMRKKRQEVAQKQTTLNEQMAPYKQRMLDELEKLNQEMADEERSLAEEEERFSASVEMLKEFKNGEV